MPTGIYKHPSHSEEWNKNIAEANKEEKGNNWKGDKVGYQGVHRWVKKHKSKPSLCEECHNERKLQIANLSGKYKRDVNDFKWLCYKCHIKFDFPDGLIGKNFRR